MSARVDVIPFWHWFYGCVVDEDEDISDDRSQSRDINVARMTEILGHRALKILSTIPYVVKSSALEAKIIIKSKALLQKKFHQMMLNKIFAETSFI